MPVLGCEVEVRMGIRERKVRKGIEVYENGDDGYLYLPGELLVDRAHEEFTRRVLDGQIRGTKDAPERFDVTHFEVEGDLHGIVEQLRKEGVRCGPNHVLSGEPRYKGGPGSIVEPAALGFTEPKGDEGAGVKIAVLDTGYTTEVHTWLDALVETDGAGNEALDAHSQDGS